MSPEDFLIILLSSIIKLFLISITGYGAVRFRLISDHVTEILSRFVIYVSLPCLIIATLGAKLQYEMLGELSLCALAALALNVMSIVIAFIYQKLFIPHEMQGRRLFISLSAFQNSGYLPIPLVTAVLLENLRPQGLILTFVYIMVMGLLFWSLGIWLISEGSATDWRDNVKKLANPPVIALLLGLLFLIQPIKEGFESLQVLRKALTLVGNTTIPLVMVVLGASFGKGIPRYESGTRIIGISAFVKLVFIPAVALLSVKVFAIEGTFAFVLILQAAMPAAMNHIVVVHEFGGNVSLTARALFVQYMLSIITVPLFLYIFQLL
jgi:predicted permease